jgi:predicted alpha/beta-fold hydrolase
MAAKGFRSAWWLPGPHCQTLWPTLVRRRKKLALRRERFELADGDFVDLDWTALSTGPLVLVLHGLEGSIKSAYAHGLLRALNQQGLRAALMHFRGCSGEVNRLPRSYHLGETSDLATVINALQAREPGVRIAVVGFSAGGNVLLKWLGETAQANPLVAAVAVSVPFQLDQSVARLRKGFSRVYERHLLRRLCRKVARKFRGKTPPFPLPSLSALKTLREFDEKITAPLYGFANADAYYHYASSRQYLTSIHVPTLLLQARDDPFMPASAIPTAAELSKTVTLEVTPHGGHVGFVSGRLPWRPRYWLDERIPAFLQAYLTR